jgi:hypothetical protein
VKPGAQSLSTDLALALRLRKDEARKEERYEAYYDRTVGGCFLWSFGAFMLLPNGQKCDAENVLATVESLAADKMSSLFNLDLLLTKGGSWADRNTIRSQVIRGERPRLAFDSFRERGSKGRGVRCAAIAYVIVGTTRTFEFSAEYSVEPTTDGKTIVTARFMPN